MTEEGGAGWVSVECDRILKSVNHAVPDKGYVLFETGYGPSGLPHIGTFGEVVRTVMVMNALKRLRPDIPTRLFVFSDDMDGLRKIPDNVPNQDMLKSYIGYPLTSIPDPFGECESYGAYMNNKLKQFLDGFGFKYEFKSSTECYKSGVFNDSIKQILGMYEDVKSLVLPILGEERQKTYQPILPVSKVTGKVIVADIKSVDPLTGIIVYEEETGELIKSSALDGNVKMQWKIDWGMRWCAFNVNYEMHGKDLDSSAEISSKLCVLSGKKPPVLYRYEMFQDSEGKKISKSKGNGISIEEWLSYAPPETLALYMYMHPHKAKRLSFDSIPKMADDYLRYNIDYFANDNNVNNPLLYIHDGSPPKLGDLGITFSMMLNLACACNPEDVSVLRNFIDKRPPSDITGEGKALLDVLAAKALKYYNDKVKPYKKYRAPTLQESQAFRAMRSKLAKPSDDYQELVVSAGEEAGYERSAMRPWFRAIYQVLFGQDNGPRIGTFITIYGPDKTIRLIDERANL